jgi:hypothetical protein
VTVVCRDQEIRTASFALTIEGFLRGGAAGI